MVKESNQSPYIRRYTLEDELALFALIEREGEEWTYWQGDDRAKYAKALDNCIVYLVFEGDTLCGYARCRDDDGFEPEPKIRTNRTSSYSLYHMIA